MSTWRAFASFGLPVRLLLVNQFAVNCGFFMLVPFLAAYFTSGLGMAAVTVGLVLGIRTLSQQALFLVGGTAADRLGARPVILVGCGLRAVGFGLFAVVESVPGLVVASVLSGFAGALFSPAVRAYISLDAEERRAEAFALFNVFGNVGTLVGPLLGTGLLVLGFRHVAIGSAVIFLALTIAQALALPPRPVERRSGQSVLTDWRAAITNRRFAGLTIASAAMFTLYTQLYLALPLEGVRVTGSQASVAAVFLVSTVVTILWQVPVTSWFKRRTSPGAAITVGLVLMGVAFLPPLLAAPAQTTVVEQLEPTTVVAWVEFAWQAAPVLLATALLSLGIMIAQPFAMDLVPVLGSRELTGTYFGVFYLAAGVASAVGNAGTGWALDVSEARDLQWLPWLGLSLFAFVCAGWTAALHLRGRLSPGPEPLLPISTPTLGERS